MKSFQKTVLGVGLSLALSVASYAGWEEAKQFVEGSGQEFGYSVAADGSYAVVGAPMENSGQGALYVFYNDSTQGWIPFQKIADSNLTVGNLLDGVQFGGVGTAVDIAHKSTTDLAIIIGAPSSTIMYTVYKDVLGTPMPFPATKAGSANIVFELNTTSNNLELSYYDALEDYNQTGNAVAIGYKHAMVGLSGYMTIYDNILFASAGYPATDEVKTFWHRPSYAWHEFSTSGDAGEGYGKSIAMDKDASHLIVGSPERDRVVIPTTHLERGKATIYKLTGQYYLLQTYDWSDPYSISRSIPQYYLNTIVYNEYTHFGQSVAIAGDQAIIGAELENASSKNFLGDVIKKGGEAYIVTLTDDANNTWGNGQALTGSNISGNDDEFGARVAIEGNTAVVGAPAFNGSGTVTGAAYVFDFNGTVWNESQRLAPVSEGNFGSDVAISGGEVFVGNSTMDIVTSYLYHEIANGVNPILMMYLLD